AVLDQQARTPADRVFDDLGTVVGRDQHLAGLVTLLDLDPTGGLGDPGETLRGARLEELDDTGQTLGDGVSSGRTTGVEGTHRQLRAGLTDGLGGDEADGLTDVDQLARGQRTAVALGAGAGAGFTGEHGAHLDLGDTRLDELGDLHV